MVNIYLLHAISYAAIVSVNITGHERGVIAGNEIVLECTIAGTEMLGKVSFSYNWTRNSNSTILSSERRFNLTPMIVDANVVYSCEVTITLNQLMSPATVIGSETIRVFGKQ